MSTRFDRAVMTGMDTVLERAQVAGLWDSLSVGVGTLAPTDSGDREWNLGFSWGVSLAAGMLKARLNQTMDLRRAAETEQPS